MKTVKLLLGISPFFVLVPIVILFYRSRYLSTPLKWIGAYLLLCAATGFVSFALWCMKANNMWVLPFQTTIELPLIFLAIYTAIGNVKTKPYVFSIACLFVLFSIVNSTFIQSVLRYNSYALTVGSLLIIAYCIYYFAELIRQMNVKSLGASPMFWISSAIFFYYSSSLFLFALGNSLMHKSTTAGMWIWTFHVALAALFYALISIGLWKSKTV